MAEAPANDFVASEKDRYPGERQNKHKDIGNVNRNIKASRYINHSDPRYKFFCAMVRETSI